MSKNTSGITVKKSEDFSEWYTQAIIKSELADYTDVSCCIVFRPASYQIWEKITKIVDEKFKKEGIQNSYFPLLIPEKLLSKEKEHVEGFSPEVAWVTEAGNSKLSERLAVRPTSETIMYQSFSKWIKSWKDLPLRLNQWNNVVRWEFKHPIPFLRTREFLWNEGHTVFATKEEAEAERVTIIGIYEDVVENYMALKGLIGKKSEKEKFAGAVYTVSMEYLLPNGKAIQGPDFHHDGQNFSKAFEINFLDKDEKKQYAYQNTFAITTRMLGVMLAIHGDDKGLVIPPKLAENKVVIIPILFDDSKEKIIKVANEIKKELKKFNPKLDDRDDYSPGWKYHEWELKGIPIRLELGPKDLEKNQVVLVRRDNSEKKEIKIKDISKEVESTLEKIQENLFIKSEKHLKSSLVEAKNWNDFKTALSNKKIVLAPFCNKKDCEEYIKDKTKGGKSLNIPFSQQKIKEPCIHCKKEATVMCYFGKSY